MTKEKDDQILPDRYLEPGPPSYHSQLDRIKQNLTENRSLSLLLIDASSLERIEQSYGKKIYRDIMTLLHRIVVGLRGDVIRKEDILTVNRQGGDQVLIFLAKKRDEKAFFSTDLEGVSDRVSKHLNEKIFKDVFPYLKGRPNITVGHAIVLYNPLVQEESLIERLIEDAKTMARFQKFKSEVRNKEKLQEIIIKEEIKIVFQPIADLKSRKVIGYEALSRGPQGTEYENPYFLFDIAREVGLIFELDRICRKKALIQAAQIDAQVKLFVNCLPTTIHDPEFKGAYLKEFLADVRRSPHNVVMEISEREAIDDYAAFRGAIAHYSDLGFSIAVDDTGAGYSSLEAIVELQPNFLKLDISMVRGIHTNLLKQEMVKAMVAFSRNMNAKIIAEGIETQEELDTLIRLGIPLGQGFFLGRPAELAISPQASSAN
jgi:EAL domain-containing protein (putative c-di-GMP-specific phosphodiesterase class I)